MKCLLTSLFVILTTTIALSQIGPQKAKNVILIIGDGMGLSQLSTAYFHNENGETPNFSRFPIVGLSQTRSATEKVTDSAAGAVAFSSGIKTNNGAIGMDTSQFAVQTLSERIAPQNIKCGLIATSSITHATPAAFYAHASSRRLEDSIALQLTQSKVDFFAGGGLKFFDKRKDSLQLLNMLQLYGFDLDTAQLSTTETINTNKRYAYLGAKDGLRSKEKGRDNFLQDASMLAMNYLNTKADSNGFFLMIESSQIDWEGHNKNYSGIVKEVKELDKVIGSILDCAEQDGETLVILTADHETGGLALSPPYLNRRWDYKQVQGSFFDGTQHSRVAPHTATLVPVLAFGPNVYYFSGIYPNTDIFHKMIKSTGW